MTVDLGGRPPKFTDLTALQLAIDEFFQDCDTKGEPYTVTGLALALDTTRETLCDYGRKEGFSDTIKRAKQRVENFAEKRLYGSNVAGPIFALKNFGWKDTQTLAGDPNAPLGPKSVEVTFVRAGTKPDENPSG